MRVMIDSNILDCLDKDTEALDELINRPDILLMVTPAQEQEVAAISDPAKRGRLEDILSRLCRHLAVPSPSLSAQVPKSSVPSVDSADDKIIATAKATGCNLLVSQDLEIGRASCRGRV